MAPKLTFEPSQAALKLRYTTRSSAQRWRELRQTYGEQRLRPLDASCSESKANDEVLDMPAALTDISSHKNGDLGRRWLLDPLAIEVQPRTGLQFHAAMVQRSTQRLGFGFAPRGRPCAFATRTSRDTIHGRQETIPNFRMTKRPQVVRDKGASFLRVFRIVEAVVDASVPIDATRIAKLVGLPAPTVHRLCKMLVEQRIFQYEMGGKRLLSGPRMFDLGTRILAASHFNLERRAIMETLVAEVGETCNIAIPDGLQMIYAERVEAKWPLRIQLPAGTRVPIHCTASGKLYLSHLEPVVFHRILRNIELTVHTARSIIRAEELEAEVTRIRSRGYSTDDEEFIEGMVAVSVPIADPKRRFCAGLALHGPKFRTTLKMALDKLDLLQGAARQIEELMRIEKPPMA